MLFSIEGSVIARLGGELLNKCGGRGWGVLRVYFRRGKKDFVKVHLKYWMSTLCLVQRLRPLTTSNSLSSSGNSAFIKFTKDKTTKNNIKNQPPSYLSKIINVLDILFYSTKTKLPFSHFFFHYLSRKKLFFWK